MKYIFTLVTATCLMFSMINVGAGELGSTNGHVEKSGKTNSATASKTPGSVFLPVTLPGSLTLDITLAFEDVTNLSLSNAGLSVSVVNPLDSTILTRMPSSDISIPAEFPVMVLIEPPSAGPTTLAFDGLVEITLLTPNLPYYPGTRLRLFSAHAGGNFEDITRETSQGSYRVRGSGGTFSEFIIALDARDTDAIVDTKVAAIQSMLSGYSAVIDTTVFAGLQSQLDSMELSWEKRSVADAISGLDSFKAAIVAASSTDIPNSWDAIGGPDNVAGILLAKADTLRFSLVDFSLPVQSQ